MRVNLDHPRYNLHGTLRETNCREGRERHGRWPTNPGGGGRPCNHQKPGDGEQTGIRNNETTHLSTDVGKRQLLE